MTPKNAQDKILALPRFRRGHTLAPVKQLLAALHNPQDDLAFIHVAGTNGKGSISTMCASILQASGYCVGLYTSPYINSFRERFQINNVPASPAAFADATREVFTAMKSLSCADELSQFDVITAIGFLIFARSGCRIVVLECGLGGKWDATNVISPPLVAVIGNIGFDHMEQLGDTIAAITAEKCGIVKKGTGTVICAPQDYAEASPVVAEAAACEAVPFVQVRKRDISTQHCGVGRLCFSYRRKTYESGLAAAYQAQNAATALEVMAALSHTPFAVSEEAIRYGLANAFIPARFEALSIAPLVLLDGAHNRDGLLALRQSMERIAPTFDRLYCLVGMLQEKAPEEALSAFFSSPVLSEKMAGVVTVTPPTPRACEAGVLAEVIRTLPAPPPQVVAAADMQEALKRCFFDIRTQDALLCFGSLYMMGDLRRLVPKLQK